ncbi:MAG TPA: AsmA family protein [Bacteroidia bacterium]|nr:AsmA family protein [Bacteroidia bacterium]
MSSEQPKAKKSLLKRILKWSGISLLLLLVLIIIAPFIFKDKIVQIVKDEANNNLNAKVDFGDFDLTLFSSFPDFRFKIQNVSVINVEPFKGDTLAYIKELSFDLNIKSVISGDKYQVNSLVIDEPKINGIVMHDGKANWDIAKASSDTTAAAPADTTATKFALKLKSLEIKHANITYNDMQGNMSAVLKDMNYTLSGDFTQDNFLLSNLLEIAELSYDMGGVGYLTKAKTRFKADIDMDMPNMKFTFKENELSLNDLGLSFDGFVSMPKEDITMDLKFAAKQTEFKSILSLIPSVYSKDFASVKTEGSLKLNGKAAGTMHTSADGKSDTYPSFEVNLGIANAMFKYPSLPKSVNNINIDVHVENKKDYLDATVVDVNKFHLEMAGNPIDMWAHVKTPISDPDLSAEIKGIINMASVKEFVPLEKGDEMSGVVKADISAAGRMSSIDKKEYDKFKMAGSLEIDKMNYKTTTLPYAVMLNMMKLNFTNQYVELAGFDALMGKSDVRANGKIDNFLQYIFKDSLIKGNFNVQSNFMDLNELMSSSTTETAAAQPAAADTAAMTVAEVPGNIDFNLNANFVKVLYDNLTIDNMVGNIVVRQQKVDMTNLNLGLLGGKVLMNGYYETTNPKKPTVDLTFKVDNFDIQKTFAAFNTVQKLAPIGQYAKGMFTATLENFKADLDQTMSPILSSLHGNGVFKTNSVSIGGFPAFTKLGEALKIEQLKNLTLQNVVADYEFKDGRVFLRNPVKVKIDKIDAEITGSTGFDQTIDYNWKMTVPTEMFGAQANNMVGSLLGQANAAAGTNLSMPKTVKVNVGFGGTVTNPTVKTGTKAGETGGTVKDQLVGTVKDKANEEAQKILADAQAQVEKLKADAQTASDKLKAEAYAAADKQVEDVKNPIAKIAAKKAAELAKKEADKQAQKILDEAEVKSQKILEDAKAKSAAAASK